MQVKVRSKNFKILIDESAHMGGTDEAMLETFGTYQGIITAAYTKVHHIT
jgi:hypothetical protein